MTKFNLNLPFECLYQIPKGEFDIRDIAIGPDSQILASATGGTVKLWDLQARKLLRELTNYADGLCLSIAISPDGKIIAGACQEYSVAVWNLQTGEYLKTLNYITEFLHDFSSVAFLSDNVTLIAGGTGITEMWDLRTGKSLNRRVIGAGSHLALSPNGHLIGGNLNVVEMAQIPRTGPLHRIDPLPSGVKRVAISRDGLVCAAGFLNGTIKLWQWKTFAERTIPAHSNTVKSIAFSSDGQTLVSASSDKSIKFWNVETGELLGTISQNLGEVYRMALSPDDRTLVCYDSQRTIKVWRLSTSI